jgi:O-antigen ligase
MSWRVDATLALTAWGALTFGAVYPWAFLPLFAGCAALGASTLVQRRRGATMDRPLAISLVLLLAAIALQLIPVPASTIGWISPETDVVLRRYAVGYPGTRSTHPLSIEAGATLIALAAAVALCLLLLGLSRALTRDDTQQIARGVCLLGVVLALAGIVQKAMWNGKIYGFWTPIQPGGDAFGPFVNRNHFAGWMLMALPLAVGHFCACAVRGTREVKPGWRNRLVWFSSAHASETILVGFAVVLMALALTLTMSRSGIVALLAALIIAAWCVARRQPTVFRRAMVAGYFVLVIVIAVGWSGFDRITARFAETGVAQADGRLGIWRDTWRLARLFPLVGTGLNTYGTATLFYQTVNLNQHFAQAHNDYLQVLAEGGVLVCVPATVVIVGIAWTIRRRFREGSAESSGYWLRFGAVTGILAIALQEISDFSLQMPGNAVLFAVLLAIAIRPSIDASTRLHDHRPKDLFAPYPV